MENIFIKCLKSEEFETGLMYGQFSIDFLEPGQGITIGNHLRRILLADVGGKAISAVRIANLKHEFTTIPGIREDVLELLLNLKGIALKFNNTKTEFARLKVQGPKVITADLIEFANKTEVVNKNHYIATLLTPAVIEMEFKINYGTGYKLASQNSNDNLNNETNFLQVDSVFSPIRTVNFKIQNIYDPKGRFREKLFLEVSTDGSIEPIVAVKKACAESVKLFLLLLENKETEKKLRKKVTSKKKLLQIEPYLEVPIEELQLSVRAYNCLKKANLNTIGDVLNFSPKRLKELRNFGKKSEEEVFKTLSDKFGIQFQ